jgi:isovaleryl-CoA dehydrogenase
MGNFDLFNPTEEHRTLRQVVRRFAEEELGPQARDHDEREAFNRELFRRIGEELGLFGVTVSEEEGGAGMDPVALVIIHEEFSRQDPGFTLSYLAHEVLFVHNLHVNGSPEQHARYFPRVLSGEWLAGMGMTEPEAGTDVLGMKTTAVRRNGYYVLNGVKQFITNGNGDIFLVYAKTGPGPRDISLFLVERTFPGFSTGKKEEKMGMRASPTHQIIFEDLRVPEENLVGEFNRGLAPMMRNLEIERVTLGAQSLGIALRCVDIMCRYAIQERKAFGQPLCSFGQIQRFLAESYARTEAARSLLYNVAYTIDPAKRRSLGAASAKLVAATTAEEVARNAIQVLGGYGYCREYDVERLYRDAVLLSIGGGTNEAMQKNIAADLVKRYS